MLEFRDSYVPAVPHLKHTAQFEAGKTYYFSYALQAAGVEGPWLVPIGTGTTFVMDPGGPIVEALIAEWPAEIAKAKLHELSYVVPQQ